MCRSAMREYQEQARTKWLAQEEKRREQKAFRRHLLEVNRARPFPWPVCEVCKRPVAPDEIHWLFDHLCDCHGIQRMEELLVRIVKARGRRRALKALKRLAR